MPSRFLLFCCLVLALPAVAQDDCDRHWQEWKKAYDAGQLTLEQFMANWQGLAESCAGNGVYELNQVRLLTSAGRFDKAAAVAKKASVLRGIDESLKINLLFAWLDNRYYLPGKLVEVDNPSFWQDALQPYRDMLAVTHGSDQLFWRLTEMNYLAGNPDIAYDQAIAHLTEMPDSQYRQQQQRLLVIICAQSGRNGEAAYRFRNLAAGHEALWQDQELVLSAALAAARAGLFSDARQWLDKALDQNGEAVRSLPRYQKAHALLP